MSNSKNSDRRSMLKAAAAVAATSSVAALARNANAADKNINVQLRISDKDTAKLRADLKKGGIEPGGPLQGRGTTGTGCVDTDEGSDFICADKK